MTGKAFAAILLLSVVFSCTNRSTVPKGIIIPDSMQLIMHDLIIADQFVSQYLIKDSLKRDVPKESQALYDKVFAVHGTTRAEFRKSLDFYSTRPDLERSIFDSLSGNVTNERSVAYKDKYGLRDSLAKKTADSLAKVKAGPPPLNPDTLKKIILQAHPGLSVAALQDSVNVRMKKRASEDSLRRLVQVRDSTLRHRTDSIRTKKVSDSIRKLRPVPGKKFPGMPLPGKAVPSKGFGRPANLPK